MDKVQCYFWSIMKQIGFSETEIEEMWNEINKS